MPPIPPKISLCSLSALKEKGRVTLWVEAWKDEVSAFLLTSGDLVVVSSICPHHGGEFGSDVAGGATVTCRWHGWQFDLTTGACTNRSVKSRLRHYRFHVSDDGVVEVFL